MKLEDAPSVQSYEVAHYITGGDIDAVWRFELIAGRRFLEHVLLGDSSFEYGSVAIISSATAKTLWHEITAMDCIGKSFFIDGRPLQVVGVVKNLVAPWPNWYASELSIMTPGLTLDTKMLYGVRAKPGMLTMAQEDVLTSFSSPETERIVLPTRPMKAIRAESQTVHLGVAQLLFGLSVVMLVVVAVGVGSIVALSISRRTIQIGIRRALGATRFDILNQFMVETWIVAGIGVLIGVSLSLATNTALVNFVGFPGPGLHHLTLVPIGITVLVTIAALFPCYRACLISPAIATKL